MNKWYQNTWVTILLLLLFFPVGIVFLWKFRPWNRWLKVLISVLATALGTIVIYAVLQPSQIESITISCAVTELDVDQSQYIHVSVLPDADNDSIKYHCSDQKVLSFTEDAWVVGLSEGEAEIYVTDADGTLTSNKLTIRVIDRERIAREEAEQERLRKFQQNADQLMDAINEIDGATVRDKDVLAALRSEYNQLPEESKSLVLNENILRIAEEQLAAIERLEQEGSAASQSSPMPEASGENELEHIDDAIRNLEVQNETQSTSTPATISQNETGQTVYIGASGTKYHREDCSTLKGNGTPITIDKALAQGRTACKVCKP